MRRTTLLLLLALVLFSFGYTSKTSDDAVSKIYLIDNTLIRMNTGRDIRFYDIRNPASPTEIGMIANDGNHDVAVRDNYMYADYQSNLVVYDISNLSTPAAIDTVRNIFNQYWEWEQWNAMPVDDVVENNGGLMGCGGGGCMSQDNPTDAAVMNADRGGSTGQGGSLARFAVVGDYLYCVDMNSLKVFEIIDPARPRYINTIDVRWDIETIFHDGEHLFIGGQSGMYIYDISNQRSPSYVSEFTHVRSCDPVVVEGNRAYVTLRGGTPCGGFSNQLDILDITDISSPKLLRSVPLTGPYGLAVRNGTVVVCDGTAGLKILDAGNPDDVKQIGAVTEITPHDVILRDNLLVVTAANGYYLYNVSDIAHPTRYSRLP